MISLEQAGYIPGYLPHGLCEGGCMSHWRCACMLIRFDAAEMEQQTSFLTVEMHAVCELSFSVLEVGIEHKVHTAWMRACAQQLKDGCIMQSSHSFVLGARAL